jgi:hypothetical protein
VNPACQPQTITGTAYNFTIHDNAGFYSGECDNGTVFGGPCAPGFVRSAVNTENQASGDCNFLQWANSDPTSCAAIFHCGNNNLFSGVQCGVQIWETRTTIPPASCCSQQ